MKCYFCSDKEDLEMAVLVLRNVEQMVFICPSCTRRFAGKKMDLNFRALQENVARYIGEADRQRALKQRCPACKKTLGEVFSSEKMSCAHCLDHFTPVVLSLINSLEAERRSILGPVIDHPEVSSEKRAAMSAALRGLEQDPHFRVMHLKERLEALIQDEKFEEAKWISEMIKKIEANSIKTVEC